MDQPHLRQEDIKALEQTRQRLYQLTNNIGSLKNDVLHSNPLPDWAALQTSGSILAKNIQGLSEHLAAHADLMERTVVYPSTNYPGRTQEGMLVQLVRKKLEPSIEEWVEEGRSIQKGTGDSEDELFNWAREWIGQRVAEYATTEAGDNYTAEEREMGIENVNTGLRRKLDDDEEDSSEEEDEDEEMSGTGAMDVTVVRKPSMGQVEFGLGELNPQNKRKDGKVRSFEDILEFATRGEILPKQEMRR